jgi:hypothetical protein
MTRLGHSEELSLEIVPGVAPAPSSVSVEISAPLFVPASDNSALSGVGNLTLGSLTSPFQFAQLTDLVVELTDGMNLQLRTLGLTVSAIAEPGATRVRMLEAGAAGDVINGRFDQLENLFEFEGEIMLSTQESPFDLSQVAPITADLLGIELSESGGVISAEFSIDLSFQAAVATAIGQIPIDIAIAGGVRGVGSSPVPGDIDGDGTVTAADIDAIYAAIRANPNDGAADLNQDGVANQADVKFLVNDILNTYFGDVDLDGEFNSSDLIAVFQLGQYEDDVALNSSWIGGDWDGDQEFTTVDFVIAFQDGGFEQGPRVLAVPEPHGLIAWFLVAMPSLARHARRLHRTKSFVNCRC